MAFDFPASPAEGTIFAPPGGPTYVFNSPTWKAAGQGQICIVSDTAPANPAHGALWWESDTGKLWIYYIDPSGAPGQWVIASPQGKPGVDGATSSVVLSKARAVYKTQTTIPVGWTTAWLITQGVQLVTAAITVKNAASKIMVKGGFPFFSGAAAHTVCGALYTSLSSNIIGGACQTCQPAWYFPLHIESEAITHGQPVGTVITAQLRASCNTNVATANSAGLTGGLIGTYLDIEEVL